ncbi:MAG: IS200/IS605 family transposase [Candidatus Thiodiazotropha sp.]
MPDIQRHRALFLTTARTYLGTGIPSVNLEQIFRDLCGKWEIDLLAFGGEDDHVHLMLELHPNIMPSKLVNNLKTVSSRLIRKQYSTHLKKFYWKPVLWSRSAGGAPLETLRDYIQNQERPKD